MIFKLKTEKQLIKDGHFIDFEDDEAIWYSEQEKKDRYSKPEDETTGFFRVIEFNDKIFGSIITNDSSLIDIAGIHFIALEDEDFEHIYGWAKESYLKKEEHPEWFL